MLVPSADFVWDGGIWPIGHLDYHIISLCVPPFRWLNDGFYLIKKPIVAEPSMTGQTIFHIERVRSSMVSHAADSLVFKLSQTFAASAAQTESIYQALYKHHGAGQTTGWSNKNKKLKVKSSLRHCWCWQNFESSITRFLHWLPSVHPSHKRLWSRAFISCLRFLVSPCLPLHCAPNVNKLLRQKHPETAMHLNSTLMSLCADADAQAWVH